MSLSKCIIYFLKTHFKMESEDQSESQEVFQGRWFKDQHHRFLTGIMEHGKDWKIVEKVVKTRTGSQVRSHAQKFFIKLSKINKERKKGKNLDLIQPSEIQREILDQFTEQNITQNTPSEISALIRKDWNAVKASYKEKKKHIKSRKQISAKKSNSDREIEQDKNSKQQNSQNAKNQHQQSQQQSYFIKIIKMNKQHFINGHDFKELIDFGQNTCHLAEESHVTLIKERERKRSFCLPDQQKNQSKLKETLSNLHRGWKSKE